MSDLRKAAEMALEALEWNYGTDLENIENCMAWLDKMNTTIPALRQALSNEFNPDWNQVEALQESLREHMAEIQRLRQALAQPEQEPAAWEHFYTPDSPFYTAPPKREWVGLTEEETREISFNLPIKWTGHLQGTSSIYDFAQAIEAKLKEKNGG